MATRREFIKCSLASLAAMNLIGPRAVFASGAAGQNKNLILVNLEGGIDTLWAHPLIGSEASVLAPLRPTLFVDPNIALPLDATIGLHPLWSSLYSKLYAASQMKLVTMVGVPDPAGSHNTAQSHYSIGGKSAPNGVAQGWIARLMDQYLLDTYQIWGVGTGNRIDFRTNRSVSPMLVDSLAKFTYRDRSAALGGSNESAHSREVIQALLQVELPKTSAQTKLRDGTITMQNAIARVAQIAALGGLIGNYPDQSVFADQAKDVARVVKDKSMQGVSESLVVYMKRPGLDTHGEQLLHLPDIITDVSESLSALIDDLVAMGQWSNTIICLFSEFSRTIRQNGDGTDHGEATSMLLLGGGLNTLSPIHVGPIISAQEILSLNKIPLAIDFRNVFAELVDWMGFDSGIIFPEPYVQTPLGLA